MPCSGWRAGWYLEGEKERKMMVVQRGCVGGIGVGSCGCGGEIRWKLVALAAAAAAAVAAVVVVTVFAVGLGSTLQHVRYGVVESVVRLLPALGKGTERVVEGALVHPASAVCHADRQLQ